MPIIRRVTTVGAARGITLPKSWLEYLERRYGVKIREVAIEVDEKLTIIPIISNEGKKDG